MLGSQHSWTCCAFMMSKVSADPELPILENITLQISGSEVVSAPNQALSVLEKHPIQECQDGGVIVHRVRFNYEQNVELTLFPSC